MHFTNPLNWQNSFYLQKILRKSAGKAKKFTSFPTNHSSVTNISQERKMLASVKRHPFCRFLKLKFVCWLHRKSVSRKFGEVIFQFYPSDQKAYPTLFPKFSKIGRFWLPWFSNSVLYILSCRNSFSAKFSVLSSFLEKQNHITAWSNFLSGTLKYLRFCFSLFIFLIEVFTKTIGNTSDSASRAMHSKHWEMHEAFRESCIQKSYEYEGRMARCSQFATHETIQGCWKSCNLREIQARVIHWPSFIISRLLLVLIIESVLTCSEIWDSPEVLYSL